MQKVLGKQFAVLRVSLCAEINQYTATAVVTLGIRAEMVERACVLSLRGNCFLPFSLPQLWLTAAIRRLSPKKQKKWFKNVQESEIKKQCKAGFICITPFNEAIQSALHKT